MMNRTFESCNPAKPIPVFEMHGTDDSITLWQGDPDYSKEHGGYKAVEESIDLWINLNKCTDSKIDTLPNLSTTDSSFVVREVHIGGRDDHEVWLYTLVRGKHDWPGSWGNRDIIASEEIWKFFKLFIKKD